MIKIDHVNEAGRPHTRCELERKISEADWQLMATREVKTGKADALDAILTQFYDAVLEPDALLPALARFDHWVGSTLCHMLGWNRVHDCAQFSFMTRPEFLATGDAYANYYAPKDPRRALVNRLDEGIVVQCADYFDSGYVERNEFYQDLLIQNSLRYSAGGCAFRDESVDVLIVFNHCVGQPAFSMAQIQGLKRLFPHLRKTLRLMSRTETLRAGLYAGEAGLQSMGQALIVLNRQQDILFCNEGAEAILRERHTQRVLPLRMAGTPLWSPALGDVLRRVQLTRRTESLLAPARDGSHVLTVIALPREGIGQRAQTVAPMHGQPSWRHDAVPPGLIQPFGQADLMILISRQNHEDAISAAQLAQLYALSPAEARLAHHLAKGLSIEEHAITADVSITTARNQLRAVLGKTGYRRQQDLVRALSRLPASLTSVQ
ncbi:helix-turn-helix transcriptional regulator [Paraburkholderia oxyphila]|uniref:helix-turn-helix transcriptional regulator n=1 Tax=Paraburkholderia oxyphila TaxID=614212 RepID=UPI0012ECCFC8|nr:helix-turn-helix transcriptional regulator [Paraburkholderia oxyphila]